MESVLSDFRIALRSLRRRPGYFAASLLTLVLGIGASTAIFSVVEAALLRPLPFADAGRLAMVWGVAGPNRDVRGASYIEIADWRRLTSSFQGLSIYDETNRNLSGDGEAEQLEAETVSPGFFRLLGAAPASGRTFTAEDDRPGGIGAAVISDALWHSRFGGDPGVLGRRITLDDQPFTVIGVMRPGFKGLSFDTDIWTTLAPFLSPAALEARGNRWLGAVGRLKPGVTPDAAQADLANAAAQLATEFPDINRDRGAQLTMLRDSYLTGSRAVILVLLGGAGLLLLIACGNVANLQLVRASERMRELSVRHALGASRARLARQLVTESIALSLTGAVGGVMLASAALGAMLPLIPAGALPTYVDVELNTPVLLFAVAVAVVSGVLVGTIPALRAGSEPATALRETRSSGTGWRAGRPSAQQALVAGEVALSLVLLVAAGLAVSSLRKQLVIDPGFRADQVLAARISLTGDRYDAARRRAFVDDLLARLRAVPGVHDVAVGSDAPLRGNSGASFLQREGHPDEQIRYYRHTVTPSYFATLGIPIVRGRGFTSEDASDAPGVVVVSAALAARFWPGEDPLGKRLRVARDWATVIGIAGNVHFRDLTTALTDPSNDPDVYFAYSQISSSSFEVVVRSGNDPASVIPVVRATVGALDPVIPISNAQPLSRDLASWTALGRLTSALLATFGALSLILATIGLYGVMAFIVRRRRQEIAIRSAVGAQPESIRAMVLRQGMTVVGVGLVIGGVGSLAIGRVLAGLFWGVSATDPLVLGGSVGALALTAFVANWLPATQAVHVDPQVALMTE